MNPSKEPKDQGPQVFFEHVSSLREVKFHGDWEAKLSALWDQAYIELEEGRRPDDRLKTEKGADLMPHLGKSLRELQDAKLVPPFKFQIVGPTGGAGR